MWAWSRLHLGAQAAQQHAVWVGVAGVPLEARALEPLHLEHLAVDGLLEWLGDRQAEQRQAFLRSSCLPGHRTPDRGSCQ